MFDDDDELDPTLYEVVKVGGGEQLDASCFDELPDYDTWRICFEHRIPSGTIPLKVNDTRYDLDCDQAYEYLRRLRDLDNGSQLKYVIHKTIVDVVVFGKADESEPN